MLEKERDKINDKSREEWELLIEQWIHDETDRIILKRYYLDGWSLYKITDMMYGEIQYDQVKRRIKRAKTQLFKHI